MTATFQEIEIRRLVPTADNPRAMRRDEAFKELVASIRSVGVIQPLLARPMTAEVYDRLDRAALEKAHGGGRPAAAGEIYDLRAGHRRLEAAKAAGLSTVPVLVRPMTDAEAMEATVTENLQREDLRPLEEGRGVQRLLDVGWDLARIADRLGKTPTWVARRAKLTALSPKWAKLADDAKHGVSGWSSAMLEEIAVLPVKTQEAFLADLRAYEFADLDLHRGRRRAWARTFRTTDRSRRGSR